MRTYVIVKAGEEYSEERINQAIRDFGYANEDVIAIAPNGRKITQLETLDSVMTIVPGSDPQTIEDAAEILMEHLAEQDAQQAAAAETPQAAPMMARMAVSAEPDTNTLILQELQAIRTLLENMTAKQ